MFDDEGIEFNVKVNYFIPNICNVRKVVNIKAISPLEAKYKIMEKFGNLKDFSVEWMRPK